jgi:class 3 adenylate cyclase
VSTDRGAEPHDAEAHEPQPLETRRQVTVVFADVVGSTSLAEARDVELLHRILARFFETAAEALQARGGRVREFVGDQVFATFGYPIVHEDHARRAMQAAFDLRAAMGSLNAALAADAGVELGVRIGVNTGEVLTGRVASGHEVLLGDAVNVASRLASVAPADGVALGPGAWPLVRDLVDADPLDPIQIRGRTGPVPAWIAHSFTAPPDPGYGAARGPRPLPSRPGPDGEALPLPLVGRDAELAHLQESLRATAARTAARTVLVSGEPGIGKTTLLGAFTATIEPQAPVLFARCVPDTSADSGPVLRQLAAALLEHGDLLAQGLDRTGDEREAIERRLQTLAMGGSLPLDEATYTIRRATAALAHVRPVVAMVEDAHWAPDAIVRLAGDLGSLDAPVLGVMSAREELEHERTSLIEGFELLTLQALPDHDRAGLLDASAPTLSDDLCAAIAGRSRGNPLFLLEMARVCEEADTDDITLPPTVQGLLDARVARLPEWQQRVLRHAAVIGDGCTLEQLLALGHADPDDVDALTGRGLLDATAEGRWMFHHALVRDAAYDSIPKQARADLHERYARWLLATSPAEHVDAEAGMHLAAAHDLKAELHVDAAALATEAGHLLTEAGVRSFGELADYPRTRELLERAEGLLPEGEGDRDRLRLRVPLASAVAEAGELHRSADMLEETRRLAREAGDPVTEGLALYRSVMLHQFVHTKEWLDRQRRDADRLIPALEAIGAHEALSFVWLVKGIVVWQESQAAETERCQLTAIRHAALSGSRWVETQHLAGLAIIWSHGPTPAAQALEQARALEPQIEDHLFPQGLLAVSMPPILAANGLDLDDAMARADAIAEGLHSTLLRAFRLESGTTAHQLAGRLDEAWEFAQRLAAVFAYDERATANWALYMADVQARRGDLAAADTLLRSFETMGDPSEPLAMGMASSLRAVLAAADGDHATAERSIAQARGHIDGCDWLVVMGDAHLRIAHAHTMLGNADAAAASARTALELFRRKGSVPSIARAERALASVVVEGAPRFAWS